MRRFTPHQTEAITVIVNHRWIGKTKEINYFRGLNQRYNSQNFMAKKKAKSVLPKDMSEDLWVSPRLVRKTENSDRTWGSRDSGTRGGDRFLELADIALGLKKPEVRKKHPASASLHTTSKTEPYSR